MLSARVAEAVDVFEGAISPSRRICQLRRQTSPAFSGLKMERVNVTGPREPATLDGGIIMTVVFPTRRQLEPVLAQQLLIVVASCHIPEGDMAVF